MRKSKIRFPGIKYVPLVNIKSHIKYELRLNTESRKSSAVKGIQIRIPLRYGARIYLATKRRE